MRRRSASETEERLPSTDGLKRVFVALELDDTPARLANLAVDPWGDFQRAAAPLPSGIGKRRKGKT